MQLIKNATKEKLRGGFYTPDSICEQSANIVDEDFSTGIGAWTPAGIMIMRVIESAVRKYYKDITKTDKKESWGYLLKDLEENYSEKTDKKLIDELSYIRKHIRNPLAHPEDLYESHEEADIAFVHAKKVLTSIYS